MVPVDQAASEEDENIAPAHPAVVAGVGGKHSIIASENTSGATIVGTILGTGNRTSQLGVADQFAGTGTAQYALVQLDCSLSSTYTA